jgi:UPF0755 protein
MIQKKKTVFKKILFVLLAILIISGGCVVYVAYQTIYTPNIATESKRSEMICIPTGSNFEDVLKILSDSGMLKNKESFISLAKLKKYKNNIKPGRYRILPNISNNKLINLLRAGIQEPVNVTFHNIRKKEQLVSVVCKKLEIDSIELISLLNNDKYIEKNLEIKTEEVLSIFIPNTYQFKWNTSAKQFVNRMELEYKKFWNAERKAASKKIGLSQPQVSILASIVQAEQLQFPQERPVIARLYLNRLKIGMPLQSDPTIIFALGDFTINRVLDINKEVISAYNTYKNTGLPPGPIYLPDISSIDAVLYPQSNDYLYMCAKEDFSGKHNFAKSLAEHNRNAQKYRSALNKLNIFK